MMMMMMMESEAISKLRRGGQGLINVTWPCGDDLREIRLSSSSPLWSSISTLPARLIEYWRTLSNGFSRSCKVGGEKWCSLH